MGFTAAAKYSHLGYLDFPWLDQSCLSLYLAGISWTLIYDTIYAHQDLNDDTALGLGSTARRFGENTKLWLSGFSFVMATSLLSCGILSSLQWPYYLGVAGVVSHLAWQVFITYFYMT
jgi:4-hydroxybenzoate polyprenyltransferase